MYYIIVISSVVERSLHALRLVEMTFCLIACAGGLRLGIHGVVMRLLKDHIFEQRDGIHVLLLHLAILLGLANDHSRSLRLEQHSAGGDGACTTILNLVDADARKTYLEDTDTIELDLLAHLEEVLHSLTQLLEYGLDITLLHTGLTLDKLRQLLCTNEMVVIHCLGEILTVSRIVLVVVL